MDLKYTTLPSLFSAIADEIRTKKGTSDEIVADDFPDEISTISSGGGSVIPPDLPKDGKTRICYQIPEGTTGGDLVLTLAFTHNTVDTQTTVDWGDESTPVVSTGSGYKELTHTPSAAGTYVASVNVDSGSITIGGSNDKTVYGAYNKNNAGYIRRFIKWAVLGSSVTLSSYAFAYCVGLEAVEILSTITSIPERCFYSCTSLKDVTLPKSVVTLAAYAFGYCTAIKNLEIPEDVETVSAYAFNYCVELKGLALPLKVADIPNYTFSYCYSLTTMEFSDAITSIGANALSNDYGFKKIRFAGSTPPVVSNSSAFSGLPATCIISVPVGSLSSYQSATNYPSAATYTYIEEA